MKYFVILAFFISQSASAFTLSESQGRSFSNDEIDVFIASTSCDNAGFSTSELTSMVQNAVDDYWNKVPTSALYLDVKGIEPSFDLNNRSHSEAINSFVPAGSIVAGCNNDFDDPAILGGAVIDCSNGCKAVLILNAMNGSNLANKSRADVEAVIAHEIGHAIGLGHSQYEFNLMWFSTGQKTQKWLGQDDIDGVTYLYPHDSEFIGLFGSCATIKLNDDNNQFPGIFIFSLMFVLLLGTCLRKSLGIGHT